MNEEFVEKLQKARAEVVDKLLMETDKNERYNLAMAIKIIDKYLDALKG